MSEMMAGLTARAAALGVPLTAHVDLTYRCNERCEHCYLDHEDHGELTFAEVSALLTQLAEAGPALAVSVPSSRNASTVAWRLAPVAQTGSSPITSVSRLATSPVSSPKWPSAWSCLMAANTAPQPV